MNSVSTGVRFSHLSSSACHGLCKLQLQFCIVEICFNSVINLSSVKAFFAFNLVSQAAIGLNLISRNYLSCLVRVSIRVKSLVLQLCFMILSNLQWIYTSQPYSTKAISCGGVFV